MLFFESKLNMSNADAINQFYAWNGFVYVTPLLGGYIADTFLGRYKTILYFACLYLLGLVLFVFGSIPGTISLVHLSILFSSYFSYIMLKYQEESISLIYYLNRH